jgi:hypothetical protein
MGWTRTSTTKGYYRLSTSTGSGSSSGIITERISAVFFFVSGSPEGSEGVWEAYLHAALAREGGGLARMAERTTLFFLLCLINFVFVTLSKNK